MRPGLAVRFILPALLQLGPGLALRSAAAQELALPRSQIVIVGKLVGQDDYRQLSVQVNNSSFLLLEG
ncbi:hypothetical protein HUU05_28725, partial [candidate division KSB1 bacterium]|nr:hypothetical protein [candidate division KSB1 bacterium]